LRLPQRVRLIISYSLEKHSVFGYDPSLIEPSKMNDANWIAKRPRNYSLNVQKVKKLLKNKPVSVDEALNYLKKELEETS
jgi:dTDP-4-dehydrorhamnose reductase